MATIKRNIPPHRRAGAHIGLPYEDRYLADPRWKEAHRLSMECKFEECNKVVNTIMKDYGK